MFTCKHPKWQINFKKKSYFGLRHTSHSWRHMLNSATCLCVIHPFVLMRIWLIKGNRFPSCCLQRWYFRGHHHELHLRGWTNDPFHWRTCWIIYFAFTQLNACVFLFQHDMSALHSCTFRASCSGLKRLT